MKRSQAIQAIQEAGSSEINDLLLALSNRYQELFPNWEILYISCPKNEPEERRRLLEYITHYFKTHC